MQKTLFALLLAACLLITACGKVETPPVTEDTTETTTGTTTETTSAPTTETTAQTEPAAPPETTGITAGGDAGICSAHAELYHAFPQPWIDFIGEDAFCAWADAEIAAHEPDESGCPYPTVNVYSFIHTFNYPKERFIEEFNTHPWVDYDYQVDLLYEGEPEIIEYYYHNHGHWHTEQTKVALRLRDMKWKLIDKYPDKLAACENWKAHSLPEMLELVGNDPDDIRALTDAAAQYGLSLHFDRIEAMDADEREALRAHSAFYQDFVLLGETPYETPYEKQVADNEETARIKKERGLDLCAQICCAHNLLYHSYFDPWIAYVGADTLEAWSNAEILAHYPSTVECPYPTANVYNFIHTFNYPKERFIEDFNTVLGIEYDYPVDLLYGDDPAAVERYFAELVDRHTKMEEDAERLGDWKYDLRQQYPEQFRDYYNWKQHSLLEMLTASGADLSDAKALNETAAQYGLQLRFDTIAALDADALTALTEHSAFYQDCVLLGETPYETPYEKQVADNAAQ